MRLKNEVLLFEKKVWWLEDEVLGLEEEVYGIEDDVFVERQLFTRSVVHRYHL